MLKANDAAVEAIRRDVSAETSEEVQSISSKRGFSGDVCCGEGGARTEGLGATDVSAERPFPAASVTTENVSAETFHPAAAVAAPVNTKDVSAETCWQEC